MSNTFIPLGDLKTYLDPRLWDICSAAILQGTQYADLMDSSVEMMKSWSENIDKLSTVIEYHGLSGLTYSLAQNFELNLPMAPSLIIKASSAKHAQRWQAIVKVLALVRQEIAEEVRFFLLKGTALATQIYAEPYHRAMSDIDIMCAPEDAQQLFEQCLKAGFVSSSASDHSLNKHHHLPVLSKQIGQHTIHLEIHTYALSFDLSEQLEWQDIHSQLRTVSIDNGEYQTLSHEQMLLQLSSHAFARDQVIKLSNVVDIFRYAIVFEGDIDWKKINLEYPSVVTTMRYVRLLLNLPVAVLPEIQSIAADEAVKISGLGESMLPLREFNNSSISLFQRLKLLFFPSLWWQLIFYNIAPADSKRVGKRLANLASMLSVRYVVHPVKVIYWMVSKSLRG